MVQLLRLLCGALIGLFQSRARREAEILVLREQINVLRRKSPKRRAVPVGNLRSPRAETWCRPDHRQPERQGRAKKGGPARPSMRASQGLLGEFCGELDLRRPG